jgi:hypothetical protein
MHIRTFALAFGVVFVLVGIAGFIPALLTGPAGMADGMDHSRLFGLFAVNTLHNIVHIAFGVWGLAAYFYGGAQIYARGVAVIYAVLAVVGLIPGVNTLFGLVPLYGHDIWLHAVLAAVAAYFGWGIRATSEPVPASH